jgi:transcriptional regulator with GAF, ATPase, and Fis domain/CHASE2 domain-containing sensor protein
VARTRKHIVALGLILASFVVTLLLSMPVRSIEGQLLPVRYHLRGEVPADSNIVILYFDNDDIASLGGWPLQRDYYALLIDVLTKSGVGAIGVDVFFGEHNLQAPEKDELLASRVGASGKVVVSGYFRQIGGRPSSKPLPFKSRYPPLPEVGVSGSNIQLPYEELLQSAAGVGHTNLDLGTSIGIPLFIHTGDGVVPAFGLEVLRVFSRAGKDDIRVQDGSLSIPSRGGEISLPVTNDGIVRLNFPGSLSSFRRYRSVEVIRAYQRQQLGVSSSLDLSTLRDKIVLVSVVGEGTSRLFQTPFDQQMPSVGIHATLIENALRHRFLTRSGLIVTALLTLALGAVVVLLSFRFGYARGLALAGIVAAVYVIVTQFAFSSWSIVLPIAQPLLVAAIVAFGLVAYEHLIVRRRVAQLELDKGEVEGKLRASELKLQILEGELLDQKNGSEPLRGTELAEEIKRYKQDIKTLSAQVSDLVRFEATEPEQNAGSEVFEGIIYERGGRMKEAIELIGKIAASDANVLVLGESGTGKELVAKAIHNLSRRRGDIFVAVNCGALTETLLESELFGHERGSFTGAIKDKVGRFEYADGGTIFLDEIAETSEAFQVKLLRVVQSGEFERVGSTVSKRVDARVIAATNKNVRELIADGRFREDLYYRLNVFSVELPPLRERKGDIPLLANHFLQKEDSSLALSSTVMDAFLQYQWPGNVRELESAVKRAVILARSEKRELVQLKDLPEQVAAALKGQVDLEDQILELLRTKRFSRSSISETAEELGGLNRGTVAEYFRGICFKFFFEHLWNEEATVRALSKSEDPETNERVQKKLREYLSNVVEGILAGAEFKVVKQQLKSKYKNLPHRYHTILDEVLRSYLLGRWK